MATRRTREDMLGGGGGDGGLMRGRGLARKGKEREERNSLQQVFSWKGENEPERKRAERRMLSEMRGRNKEMISQESISVFQTSGCFATSRVDEIECL